MVSLRAYHSGLGGESVSVQVWSVQSGLVFLSFWSDLAKSFYVPSKGLMFLPEV